MISIFSINLIALWVVVLLNLLLTLRIVRWLRTAESIQKRVAEQETTPELSIDKQAPDFSVKTLAGQSVRLENYKDRSVAFIFVSPHCGICRKKVPLLVKLNKAAKEQSGIDLVLVSDSHAAETHTWIETIQEEEKVEIDLPIIIAPRVSSDFLKMYNPRGLTPYYCLINEQGVIQDRNTLDKGEWPRMQREWEGPVTVRPPWRSYT